MKKIIKYLVIGMSIFILVGCGSREEAKLNEKKQQEQQEQEEKAKQERQKKEQVEKLKREKEEAEAEALRKEEEEKESRLEKIKQENFEKVIVLDPGHSSKADGSKEKVSPESNETKLKATSGATGISTKTPEYKITLSVAKELEKILKEKGYNVILTKDSEEENISNIKRAELGNNANADLVIRLHCDSFTNQSAKGVSMLVPTVRGNMDADTVKTSEKYGKVILDSYINETGLKSKGIIKRKDLTGFNWSSVPTVLLEMGFISNTEEDRYLSNKENHQTIAKGIADGIEKVMK